MLTRVITPRPIDEYKLYCDLCHKDITNTSNRYNYFKDNNVYTVCKECFMLDHREYLKSMKNYEILVIDGDV